MNPYQAIQGPFDFTDPQHIKAYYKCTRALVNVHDGTTATLRPFLEELQRRMEIFSAQHLITITVGNEALNIIKHSRRISVQDITAHADPHVKSTGRDGQLNSMIMECINASLGTGVTNNILASGVETKINGKDSVALYIKAIIRSLEPQAIATDSGTGSGVTSIKRDPPSWEHHVSSKRPKARESRIHPTTNASEGCIQEATGEEYTLSE